MNDDGKIISNVYVGMTSSRSIILNPESMPPSCKRPEVDADAEVSYQTRKLKFKRMPNARETCVRE